MGSTNSILKAQDNPSTTPNGQHQPNWEPLLEQPAFTPTRKLRVVCVGAGFGGLMLAYKIQHELKLEDEIDLVIYERNPEIGGTWYENNYPGCACDVPSHCYVFPFEGNPDWSRYYVSSQEILEYVKRTADKYNLRKHVQVNTKVTECIWDEARAKWNVKVEHAGEIKEDAADVFMSASGFLNKWKWPDIKGLHTFQGKLVHTAAWDTSYDWHNKRVAVIGNGSSGIQTVTSMQPKVEKLVNYMRSPTWIQVNFLSDKVPAETNHVFSEQQKKAWRDDPKAYYRYRKELERDVNMFFFAMRLDHPLQAAYEDAARERMHASCADAPELEKRIKPDFHTGCRRITPGDGYLEALQQANCRDCWSPIAKVTETGIKTSDGREEEFDMIVAATGFDGSWLPQYKVVGRDGATFEQIWGKDGGDPSAFFSVQVPHMPNYFMINGPNPPIQQGTVPGAMGFMCDYILKWVMRMNRQDIRTLVPKQEAVDDYNVYADEANKRMVWSDRCRSAAYKNGKTEGRVTGVYPGSIQHFKDALEQVGGEHMDVTWRSRNRFRCLGNGMAETDGNGEGNMAPYFAGEQYLGYLRRDMGGLAS